MPEVHIASCVAFVRPESIDAVKRAILATAIAEVPRSDPSGRLVILIERATSREVIDAIDALRALDGMIALHLAYQHAEPACDLEEPA